MTVMPYAILALGGLAALVGFIQLDAEPNRYGGTVVMIFALGCVITAMAGMVAAS